MSDQLNFQFGGIYLQAKYKAKFCYIQYQAVSSITMLATANVGNDTIVIPYEVVNSNFVVAYNFKISNAQFKSLLQAGSWLQIGIFSKESGIDSLNSYPLSIGYGWENPAFNSVDFSGHANTFISGDGVSVNLDSDFILSNESDFIVTLFYDKSAFGKYSISLDDPSLIVTDSTTASKLPTLNPVTLDQFNALSRADIDINVLFTQGKTFVPISYINTLDITKKTSFSLNNIIILEKIGGQ